MHAFFTTPSWNWFNEIKCSCSLSFPSCREPLRTKLWAPDAHLAPPSPLHANGGAIEEVGVEDADPTLKMQILHCSLPLSADGGTIKDVKAEDADLVLRTKDTASMSPPSAFFLDFQSVSFSVLLTPFLLKQKFLHLLSMRRMASKGLWGWRREV